MTKGGKREGSGRKPSPHGPSMVVRLPVKLLPAFKEWLREMLDAKKPD